MPPPPDRMSLLLAILFSLFFPTLLTAVYFNWLQGSNWVQPVYILGKGLQFLFPIVFVYLYFPNRLVGAQNGDRKTSGLNCKVTSANKKIRPNGRTNVAIGVIFGLLVVISMLVVYRFLIPEPVLHSLHSTAREKVDGMGIDTLPRYLMLLAFYVCFHSLLEEYYWRWFNYFLLKQLLPEHWPILTARTISSLGFMAHHIILLAAFFGISNPLVWLFSASVAVGGWFWCWQLDQPWGFRAAWLSHAIVDAGIFGLGLWFLSFA
jgi:hypothetical protein